jgi:hypothetical protein
LEDRVCPSGLSPSDVPWLEVDLYFADYLDRQNLLADLQVQGAQSPGGKGGLLVEGNDNPDAGNGGMHDDSPGRSAAPVRPPQSSAAVPTAASGEHASAPVTVVAYPKGSYAIWDMDSSLAKKTFDPGIVGLTMAIRWSEVQTGAKTYSWTTVDTRVNEAKSAGLKVSLTLNTSSANTPAFLLSNPTVQQIAFMDTNTNHSTYGQNVSGPVFWDPTVLAAKEAFIQAAGTRYAGNATVTAIGFNFANWYTEDWSVPHFVGPFTLRSGKVVNLDQVQQWQKAGWTTATMVATGEQLFNTTVTAFPDQDVKLAIGVTDKGLDGTATTLATDIVNYAYGGSPNFFAQVDKLSTQMPVSTDPKVTQASQNDFAYLYWILSQHPTHCGLQMLADATNTSKDGYRLNGGTPAPSATIFQNAIDVGLTYKPAFLEYWSVDGENTAFTSMIQQATSSLKTY